MDVKSMRELDTATLVTLKQRIERELMRRGDVEQEMGSGAHGVNAAAAEIAVGMAELAKSAGVLRDVDAAIAADRIARIENPDAYMEEPAAPAPIAQRRFLREPDRSCGMCSGRGIKPSDDWEPGSRTVLRLCPCLWGGE